ncbi:hypothetical protein FB384_003172 [Prauserella sediminis]|uniref:Uncharacterized protein n=1 Tax=Prauserella sediminis TaxID=577680 RepID=A0A839XTC6_9PSEU|nr:hypothetical protein [Prauserella sediminis]
MRSLMVSIAGAHAGCDNPHGYLAGCGLVERASAQP